MSTQVPTPSADPIVPSSFPTEFLWNVQKYINDYLRFGDTKAALAVATVSAIMGALFKVKAQEAFLHAVGQWGCIAWLSLTAFAFLAVSAVLGIVAITPPFGQPKTRGLMYWAEVATYKDDVEYSNDLLAHDAEARFRVLARHVFIVSRVCTLKYRLVRLCILTGVVGATCAALFAMAS
jgi:hypothetical protein